MKRKHIGIIAVILAGMLCGQTVSAGIFKEESMTSPEASNIGDSINYDVTGSEEVADSILDNILEELPEYTRDRIIDIVQGDSAEIDSESSAAIQLGSYINSLATEYYGCVEDGVLNGYGAAFYKDGDFHMGMYENGERNGLGLYSFCSGDMLVGWDIDEVTQGKAAYIYSDGSVFAGEYVDNNRSGEGVLIDTANQNKITIGLWENGKYVSGYEYEKWEADDVTYYGQQVNGKIDGWGIKVFPSGNMYIGKFIEGLDHDFGVYVYPNAGSVLVAEFEYGEQKDNVYIADNGDVIIKDVDQDGVEANFSLEGQMKLMKMINGEFVVLDSIWMKEAGLGSEESNGGSDEESIFVEPEPTQSEVPEISSGKPKSRSTSY